MNRVYYCCLYFIANGMAFAMSFWIFELTTVLTFLISIVFELVLVLKVANMMRVIQLI